MGVVARWYNDARTFRLVRENDGFSIEVSPEHGDTLTREELRELRDLITRALGDKADATGDGT